MEKNESGGLGGRGLWFVRYVEGIRVGIKSNWVSRPYTAGVSRGPDYKGQLAIGGCFVGWSLTLPVKPSFKGAAGAYPDVCACFERHAPS